MSTTTQFAPTTTTTITTDSTRATTRPTVWRRGVAASVGATVVTTTIAAVASAAGVSFEDPAGTAIPVLAFTQLTLIFSLIGVGLAAVLARKARHPRPTFVRTTVALTALSVVPDFTFGFDAASALTLAGAHVVAAAIVIPTLASRLMSHRH
ncbi:MAG TPA: DUF6069 family protein [Nocardioides sp.]|nr:DUF6069 family protein [Nocardioides sp.]